MTDDELEDKHELIDIDTSGYTADYWFTGIKAYLELIMTPEDPKPPNKPLTKQGLIKQKSRVNNMVKKEFDTRFPELLVTEFDLITHYKE